jgi:hypothetical protein
VGAIIIVAQFPPEPVADDGAKPGDEIGPAGNRVRVEVVERIEGPAATGFYLEARLIDGKARSLVYNVTTATSTVLGNAIVPDAAAAGTDLDAVRQALRSLVEEAGSLEDRMKSFPLTVPDMPGLHLVTVVGQATALWTDGPEASLDTSATQRFLTLSVVEISAAHAATMRRTGAIAELAQVLRDRDPTVRIVASSTESHADGMHSLVTYVRRHPTGTTVGVVMLMRAIGNRTVTLVGQYPEADAAAFDSFRKVFRQVGLRGG